MSEENLYTFENEQYRKTYWHTCSHVMAHTRQYRPLLPGKTAVFLRRWHERRHMAVSAGVYQTVCLSGLVEKGEATGF